MTFIRNRVVEDFIQTTPPINNLLTISPRGGGRNNQGFLVFRKSAGGSKRFMRVIDFKKKLWKLPFYVLRIEKDPFRTAFIHLVCFINGILTYILATEGVEELQNLIVTNKSGFFFLGNTLPLSKIAEGTFINSLEKRLHFGGTIARSAGTTCVVLKKFSSEKILIRLPSKEEIFVHDNCLATVGRVSNPNHKFISFRSAGQMRNLGIKPIVRGVAKNPVDHPHGGGGGRPQLTAWAKTAKNCKTRKTPFSNSFIYLSRKKARKNYKKR